MQALSLPRSLSSGIGGIARILLLAVGAVGLGVVCGRLAVSHYGTPALWLLAGGPVLIAIAHRPMLGWLAVLVVLASIFAYDHLPRVDVPGHLPLTVGDAVLGATVAGTLWRRPWPTWPEPVRRFTLALLALMLWASISNVPIALHSTDGRHNAIFGYKILLYMLLAVPIALELSGRRWRALLDIAVMIAAIVSVLSIGCAVSGPVRHFIVSYSPTAATSAASSFAAAGSDLVTTGSRIRLPGLYFIYAMVLPTLVLALLVRDRWRPLRILALGLMVAAVGISLNRNMYAGVFVGLVVAVLVGGPRLRYRVLLALLATGVTIALLVVSSVTPSVSRQIVQRAATGLNTSQVANSASGRARAYEFSHALTSISRHPLEGVGWFQPYGASLGNVNSGVENIYLHIATDYGIPAALLFLLLPGIAIAFAARQARRSQDQFERAMAAAAIGSMVALLISLLAGSYLQEPISAATFAAVCGMLFATGMRAGRAGPGEATVDAQAGPSGGTQVPLAP